MLSKYQIHQNSIITGTIDAFCLVCESHLRCDDDTRMHLDKPIHRKNLDATPYFEKYKDEHVRRVKRGYFCEFCNLLIATAAKAGLHIAEPLHINNKGVQSLKRVGNAIVALNTIYINERAWQGLIDDTCVICNEEFHDEKIHKTQASHILSLVQIKVEFAAGEAIFRKMDEMSFQCLTCNLMVSTDAIKTHFTEQQHLNALQKCKEMKPENNNSIYNGKEVKGAFGNVGGISNKSAKNPCESDKKPCDSDRSSDFNRSSEFESYTSESEDEETKRQDEMIKLALKKAFPNADLSCNKNCSMYKEHKHKSEKVNSTQKKNTKTNAHNAQKVDSKKTEPQIVNPKKAGPQKVDNKKAEPQKVDPKKAEPQKVDNKKAELQKVDPKKAEPQKVDNKKAELQKVDPKKAEPQKVDNKKAGPQKGDPKKAEPQKVDNKKAEPQKVESKKAEPQKVDSKTTESQKVDSKSKKAEVQQVDSKKTEPRKIDSKKGVNSSSKSTQVITEDRSFSEEEDSDSEYDSESDYWILPDPEFEHNVEMAKYALNNFLGTEAFPLKNGIPKFDENPSKTKDSNTDAKKNTKKADTKTDAKKVDSKKAETKKVDTKAGLNETTGKTTNQKQVEIKSGETKTTSNTTDRKLVNTGITETTSKATDQKQLDTKSGATKTESTGKTEYSEKSNKNKALDTKPEPEKDNQDNTKDATKNNHSVNDKNNSESKEKSKKNKKSQNNTENNDTNPATSTKDVKSETNCKIEENKDTKPETSTKNLESETKCETSELKLLLESLEQQKDKLLENAPEYQKNGVAINFENNTAFCKQCMEKVILHYNDIETHIKMHKNKPRQHEITNPILDLNNCKMELASTEKDTKIDLNHNIKMKPKIIDVTKGDVGENHYVVPYIPVMKDVIKEEVKMEEPPIIEVAPIPETNDPTVFAKQHKLTYNKGNFDAFCRICRVKLPSSIKCMKEHVYGNKHKKCEKITEQNALENNRSTTRKRFKYFVNDVLEIDHDSSGGQDVIVNEKYCISRLSFFMITEQLNRLRCQACEVNLHESIVENHASSDDHNYAMDEAPVVLNLNNEFVREVRPGLFHCGYCNLITGNYDDLRRHLECDDHRTNKADCASRLRDHQPSIDENRRGQESIIMRYVLSRMGFRCGVF